LRILVFDYSGDFVSDSNIAIEWLEPIADQAIRSGQAVLPVTIDEFIELVNEEVDHGKYWGEIQWIINRSKVKWFRWNNIHLSMPESPSPLTVDLYVWGLTKGRNVVIARVGQPYLIRSRIESAFKLQPRSLSVEEIKGCGLFEQVLQNCSALIKMKRKSISGITGLFRPTPATVGLPHDPYPYTTLPIKSKFDENNLMPFRLLAAFDYPGFGRVSFQQSCLKYESEYWSWLVTRTNGLQDVINTKWVLKPVYGPFIAEAWNARPDRIGHTAMIIFKDNKVYQSNFPDWDTLMDFDPYQEDWVTVQMVIDYTVPEIRDLWINDRHFTHLRIGDEPIGGTDAFWQTQVFLPERSCVLVKEMQAWK